MSNFESDPMAVSNGPLSVINWSGAHASFDGDVLVVDLPLIFVGLAKVFYDGINGVEIACSGQGGRYTRDYSGQFDPTLPGSQGVTLTPKVAYLPTACGVYGPKETLETVSVSHFFPDYPVSGSVSGAWADSLFGEDGIFNTGRQRTEDGNGPIGLVDVAFAAESAGSIIVKGRPTLAIETLNGHPLFADPYWASSSTLSFRLYPTGQDLHLSAEADPEWDAETLIEEGHNYQVKIPRPGHDPIMVSATAHAVWESEGYQTWHLTVDSLVSYTVEFAWAKTEEDGALEMSNFWEASYYATGLPTLDASVEWDCTFGLTYTGWVRAEEE